MAVRADRGRWVIEFQQGGKRIFRRCPPGITKAKAAELETKIRRELFERQDLGHPEDLTLEGAIGLWLQDNRRKNQRQAVSEAKQWEPFLAGRLLEDAPEVALRAVQVWSKPRLVASGAASPQWTASSVKPAKASTINRRLMLLKAVCKAMWRRKLIGENLSPRIQTLREPPHKDVFLTVAEVRLLIGSAPTPEARSAIGVLAWTGLRVSEFLSITSTSLHRDTMLVSQTKTGKPRVVPLPPSAKPLMRQWLSAPSRPSYWELRKQFIAARKKAGLPATVTLHTLRHTTASWLINAGVDLYTVGKILGHSSPQTTQRYAHLATHTLEKAMARLK